MEQNNDEGEVKSPDTAAAKEDDVDIYGDLDTIDSDAQTNDVVKRFNSRFTPKKRSLEEDLYAADATAGDEEDDVGLYDDLNTFEDHLKAEELQEKLESLEKKCTNLENQNTELRLELEKVNKANLALRRNISSIFKTAKAELERKERQLKELQREHDALIFRRGGGNVRPQRGPESKLDTVPECHVSKDANDRTLVTINNETQCTLVMGKMSFSTAVESADFKQKRQELLETAVREEKEQRPKPGHVDREMPSGRHLRSERSASSSKQAYGGRQERPDEALEDGKVIERRDVNANSRRRRSRSPPPSKRKRSPGSPENRNNNGRNNGSVQAQRSDRDRSERRRPRHNDRGRL